MTATVPGPAPLVDPSAACAFGIDELDELDAFYRAYGFAVLRGVFDEAALAHLTAECESAQRGVAEGSLDERHGTAILVDGSASTASADESVVNYVTYLTEVAPRSRAAGTEPTISALMQRWLGPECWLLEHHRFGVVFQDARPGRESAYSRIGWHSDWQSAPHRNIWPSAAFTVHIDETSPANGFLRVVPASHLWATPAPFRNANNVVVPDGAAPWGGHTATAPPFEMPLHFEKVPGEIALFCERGDILFHDCYLWHSAARATEDGTRRRHLRGAYYVGEEPTQPVDEDFVKNAAR